MPKASIALSSLPPIATEALKQLGDNLAIARIRRRESRKLWAQRLGVSIPTLIRLEQGDPGVSIGILATAIWLLGRTEALKELADPQFDRGALESDVRAALKKQNLRRISR